MGKREYYNITIHILYGDQIRIYFLLDLYTLMKQKSMENISDQYLILIKKHHFANYNSTSGDYPTVICPSCKRCLRDRDKFGHEAKLRENYRL